MYFIKQIASAFLSCVICAVINSVTTTSLCATDWCDECFRGLFGRRMAGYEDIDEIDRQAKKLAEKHCLFSSESSDDHRSKTIDHIKFIGHTECEGLLSLADPLLKKAACDKDRLCILECIRQMTPDCRRDNINQLLTLTQNNNISEIKAILNKRRVNCYSSRETVH
jgi:hypothetical protein